MAGPVKLSSCQHHVAYCIVFPPEGSCRFPNAASSLQPVLPNCWCLRCVTSPESPLCLLFWRFHETLWWYISCGAWLCTLSSCLGYKIHSYIEYMTRKQMDSLTFKANQLCSDELYIWLFSIDPGCSHCPSRNSPNSVCGQGHFLSVVLQGLLNCSQQTCSQHWFYKLWRSNPCQIDSRYDNVPTAKQALADFL